MMMTTWIRGLLAHRSGRLAVTAAGVAVGVALLATIGGFLGTSKATMTRRSIQRVAVDWQVEVQATADPAAVADVVAARPEVVDSLPVGFGRTSGFEATTGGTTQTTGPGYLLGLPDTYRTTFPDEIRDLSGASSGVLVAQQTAANLHVAPGDALTATLPDGTITDLPVDAVVDLPQADSLFQDVGAPVGAQPQAPPDNVVLVPAATWHRLYDAIATTQPDQAAVQVHARLDHALPADPATATTTVTGRANNLETELAGAGLVGDNLGATLAAARSDALYAQVLFLFLGLPGAVLAGLLTVTVAAAAADRRRGEQALLRTRGASVVRLVRLASVEALLVGIGGSAAGLLASEIVSRIAFTSTPGLAAATTWPWKAGAAVAGVALAWVAIAWPAWRDARETTVTGARRSDLRATRSPRWMRFGLDVWLLVLAGLVYLVTSRQGYTLVLAPEGTPQISVDYWAFAGPALLWVGAGLLLWRLTLLAAAYGRGLLARLGRASLGSLADVVAGSVSRRRRLLARGLVLVALTVAFAGSTAVFNATYQQQAEVDAVLTNGADVTVTESPGVSVGPGEAATLAHVPGVVSVEPLQHRFAYVGSDLQDLYGVRPDTIVDAGRLQDAYVRGGTVRELMATLADQPDAVLVSAETVHDFQLLPGDHLNLRLQDGVTKQYTTVPFTYVGVATEFPTAPSDSFLVAHADYVAARTGSDAVGDFLVETGNAAPDTVARAIRDRLGTDAAVTAVGDARRVIGSSLTAVDLAGLTRVELGFALVLAAAATGIVLGLGFAERRRFFAILHALGARGRQLSGFVQAESLVVAVGGLVLGAGAGWLLSHMLVTVLRGVFDPPPSTSAVPWSYLAAVALAAFAAVAVTTREVVRRAARPDPGQLRGTG